MRLRAALLLWLVAPLAWADLTPRFEVGTFFSMGSAYELVLRDGTYNDPVSRLTWPIPPSMNLRFGVAMPWTGWTSTNLEATFGWALTRGTVVDEDWRTGSGTDSSDLDYGISRHEDWLTDNWSVRVEQQFHWQGFTFGLGGQYRYLAWDAWNGSYSYTYTVSGSTTTGTDSGLVLQYRQMWYIPYLLAAYQWDGRGWTFTPRLDFSPYSWCNDLDNHLMAAKRYTYLDYTAGGLLGRLSADISWTGPGFDWGLRAAGEVNWGARGSIVTTYPTTGTVSYAITPNAAGAWYWDTSLTVFVRN